MTTDTENSPFVDVIESLCMAEVVGPSSTPDICIADMVVGAVAMIRVAASNIRARGFHERDDAGDVMTTLRDALVDLLPIGKWAQHLGEDDLPFRYAEWVDYKQRLEADGGMIIGPPLR